MQILPGRVWSAPGEPNIKIKIKIEQKLQALSKYTISKREICIGSI